MSTNTLGFIMGSIFFPLLAAVATLLALYVSRNRQDFWQAFRESLVVGAFVSVALVCLWSAMFGWNVVNGVNQDHNWLVGSNSALSQEDQRLTAENAVLRTQPKVIVKAVQPQDMPLQISTKEYGAWSLSSGGKAGTAYFILGMTNKTITPIRVILSCDEDFVKFDAGFLIARGDTNISIANLSVQQVDNRTFKYIRDSPAWTPESPLAFGIFTESTKGIACKIYQNP
jgi:hypothetical protein